ncbi:MAG TPA: hypothetical protein EYN66_23090 [Myxococcales bacterium]|nr:hypothetical protein [Myxococcales bacterium]
MLFYKTQAPQKVLLIDDVVTTGQTMHRAAEALHKAGAQKIFALAVARVEKL